MYCTFGISSLSSSCQPLSYKEVSKPLDTVTYPELMQELSGTPQPCSTLGHRKPSLQPTSLFPSSSLPCSNIMAQANLFKEIKLRILQICIVSELVLPQGRSVPVSLSFLHLPKIPASPLFWLMVFNTGLFSFIKIFLVHRFVAHSF